ncbi:hypothetical protein RB195_017010 [Necator americanus]|uniref:CG-1 domain-containing protein n=1 Tax=Necator americanus TaxID=51031 RepID=A0ABR1C361_NECAM
MNEFWKHEVVREFMIPLNASHPPHNGQPPPTMAVFPTDQFNAINASWNSNQEIAQLLYSAPNHPEWIAQQVSIRPQTGAQYMFCRFDGNWFKMDGYEWKKRREGKLIREDHMKLKVNKQEILSANYAHSSVVPTFHRRVYWLTSNPEYALVHYLNTETETNLKNIMDKISACIKLNSLNLTQQQLLDQVSPIYANLLSQQDIACICEKLYSSHIFSSSGHNDLDSAVQPSIPNSVVTQQNNISSHIPHGSSHHLERRNSCSSAFRPGLSSLILRRQPSTFSDSVDVSYGGASAMNGMIDGTPLREVTSYPADCCSHSGETHRSSNQDEDIKSTSLQPSQPASASSYQPDNQQSTCLTPITDITPNSGCIKGGTKVLVIGGWYMKGHDYSVMFGERRVAAKLIQVGVLSVIVPPTLMNGVVPVRVLCNGQIISSSSEFTYNDENDELTTAALRQCMVDRLQVVVHAFGAMEKLQWVASMDEDSILSLLQSLAGRHLSLPTLLSAHPTLPSRTILHIAAALDYHKVIEHVLGWRRDLPFTREFDPLARDGEGRTPLHVAVAAGHVASARVLVRACRTTVDVLDDRGRTPCDLSCDEQMMRLTARTADRDADEQRTLPKNAEDVEHVTSTALWVLTNGETVTDEHLLRDRLPPDVEGEDSSSSILSDSAKDDHDLNRPGPSRARWCDEPLHVEISMDTDVHVPDSPKMADLFEAVTSPGIMLNDGVRAKMALLAQQIIDALPDRIKNDAHPLLDDDSMSTDVNTQSAFAYPDHNPFLSNLSHDCPADWEFHQYFANNHYRVPTDKSAEDVLSSFSGQPSSPSFDHNHLYPNKADNSSFGSTRENTLESTSFDFDKDLGEFFNMRVDGEEDPIRQRLGDLKLSDGEQREVYGAAMVIQRAYREYRARNTSRRQADAERRAAVTIQSCYRRYKQFCYFKKLHNAAIVVQKHFRLKKMNQTEQSSCPTAEVPEHPTLNGQSIRIQVPQNNSSLLREHRAATTIQLAYRGHRKRQAAARKIQKFMKESRMKLRKIQELSDGGLGAPLTMAQPQSQSNTHPTQVTSSGTHMITQPQIGISSHNVTMMDMNGSR